MSDIDVEEADRHYAWLVTPSPERINAIRDQARKNIVGHHTDRGVLLKRVAELEDELATRTAACRVAAVEVLRLEADLAQLKQPAHVLAEAERLLTEAEVEAADFPAPADRRAMADVVELCKRDGTHVSAYSLAEAYERMATRG